MLKTRKSAAGRRKRRAGSAFFLWDTEKFPVELFRDCQTIPEGLWTDVEKRLSECEKNCEEKEAAKPCAVETVFSRCRGSLWKTDLKQGDSED